MEGSGGFPLLPGEKAFSYLLPGGRSWPERLDEGGEVAIACDSPSSAPTGHLLPDEKARSRYPTQELHAARAQVMLATTRRAS